MGCSFGCLNQPFWTLQLLRFCLMLCFYFFFAVNRQQDLWLFPVPMSLLVVMYSVLIQLFLEQVIRFLMLIMVPQFRSGLLELYCSISLKSCHSFM